MESPPRWNPKWNAILCVVGDGDFIFQKITIQMLETTAKDELRPTEGLNFQGEMENPPVVLRKRYEKMEKFAIASPPR